VQGLSRLAGMPVDIVAESEGTLGLYAMLARHPHVPVRSVVLLSPIIEPGQVGQASDTVPGAALTTLNNLLGGMSPYGRSGAQALIDSVSEVGARPGSSPPPPPPGGCRTCTWPARAPEPRPAGGPGRGSATLCPVTRSARLQWWRRP
jgi:hypothetical protein